MLSAGGTDAVMVDGASELTTTVGTGQGSRRR